MRNTLLLGAVLFLAFASPAAAKPGFLSKRQARSEVRTFVAPFVDMLDIEKTVETRMVPAQQCHRVNRRTVTCGFSAYVERESRTVQGVVRVHLQRDGLLGFLLPYVLSPESMFD